MTVVDALEWVKTRTAKQGEPVNMEDQFKFIDALIEEFDETDTLVITRQQYNNFVEDAQLLSYLLTDEVMDMPVIKQMINDFYESKE